MQFYNSPMHVGLFFFSASFHHSDIIDKSVTIPYYTLD